eukprot:Nk52_evm21s243 gene=Nk52_evmTU21s243
MVLLTIQDIEIDFPFEPYECQKSYMSKVITALNNKENALLESPTGTGKTLCLLCSILAWHRAQKLAKSKGEWCMDGVKTEKGIENAQRVAAGSGSQRTIYYCSRTHSQLDNVCKELKRTSYSSSTVATVLGSRNQLCNYEKLKNLKGGKLISACRQHVKEKKCFLRTNLRSFVDRFEKLSLSTVTDIEDLVDAGKANKVCSYYLSKMRTQSADIVMMPYNYLLDAHFRKKEKLNVENAIVVIDEAHNAEEVCQSSASFELSCISLAQALNTIKTWFFDSSEPEEMYKACNLDKESVQAVYKILLRLEEAFVREVNNENGDKPLSFLEDILGEVNLNHEILQSYSGLFKKMKDCIESLEMGTLGDELDKEGEEGKKKAKEANERRHSDSVTSGFGAVIQFLYHIFDGLTQANADFFRVFVTRLPSEYLAPKTSKSGWDRDNLTIPAEGKDFLVKVACFSPGVALQNLRNEGALSIILTSGTLSPLNVLETEVQMEFPVKLENMHVISEKQMFLGAVECGPQNVQLRSVYANRDNQAYLTDLGLTIVNFCRVIPAGVLVVFPSYPFKDACVKSWESSGVMQKIRREKTVFIEEKAANGGSERSELLIENYIAHIDSGQGGAIFAVCRGKVSEGVDFRDNYARGVIITGIPYASLKDPYVEGKKNFLSSMAIKYPERNFMTGQQWYAIGPARAAIGRVIRHIDDYGAVLLCDSRFSSASSIENLPKWTRGYIKCYDSLKGATSAVSRFFSENKGRPSAAPVPCNTGFRRYKTKEPQSSALVSKTSGANSVEFRADFSEYAHVYGLDPKPGGKHKLDPDTSSAHGMVEIYGGTSNPSLSDDSKENICPIAVKKKKIIERGELFASGGDASSAKKTRRIIPSELKIYIRDQLTNAQREAIIRFVNDYWKSSLSIASVDEFLKFFKKGFANGIDFPAMESKGFAEILNSPKHVEWFKGFLVEKKEFASVRKVFEVLREKFPGKKMALVREFISEYSNLKNGGLDDKDQRDAFLGKYPTLVLRAVLKAGFLSLCDESHREWLEKFSKGIGNRSVPDDSGSKVDVTQFYAWMKSSLAKSQFKQMKCFLVTYKQAKLETEDQFVSYFDAAFPKGLCLKTLNEKGMACTILDEHRDWYHAWVSKAYVSK